jgi:hypothetical protein
MSVSTSANRFGSRPSSINSAWHSVTIKLKKATMAYQAA